MRVGSLGTAGACAGPAAHRGEPECLAAASPSWFSTARAASSPWQSCRARLAALGRQVGARVLDALVAREKGARRETKVLGALLFVKGACGRRSLARGRQAGAGQRRCRTFYIIERRAAHQHLHLRAQGEQHAQLCQASPPGIVKAVLTHSGFPAKVTAHWHKGHPRCDPSSRRQS